MKLRHLLVALPVAAILACTGTQAALGAHASGEEDPLPPVENEATFTKEHWHFDIHYDRTEIYDHRDVRPMPLPYFPDCAGNHARSGSVVRPDLDNPPKPSPDGETPRPMPRPMPYR